MAGKPRLPQTSTSVQNRLAAQPTPPSSTPKFRSGKRRVTPPKNSAFAKASPASAKCPIWLYM